MFVETGNKGTSIKMREIDPSHVKETRFTCSLVINEMLTNVCKAHINYLQLSCFLHYPLKL